MYCKKGENISTVSCGMQGGDITHQSLNLYLCPDDTFVLSIIISFFSSFIRSGMTLFSRGQILVSNQKEQVQFYDGTHTIFFTKYFNETQDQLWSFHFALKKIIFVSKEHPRLAQCSICAQEIKAKIRQFNIIW